MQKFMACCKNDNRYCEIKDEGWDDGLCNLFLPKPFCQVKTGDNHAGYIGFRNSTNTSLLANDGAMNVVVDQWKKYPNLISEEYQTEIPR